MAFVCRPRRAGAGSPTLIVRVHVRVRGPSCAAAVTGLPSFQCWVLVIQYARDYPCVNSGNPLQSCVVPFRLSAMELMAGGEKGFAKLAWGLRTSRCARSTSPCPAERSAEQCPTRAPSTCAVHMRTA